MLDLEKLEDTPHLLDILIKMEDIMDSLDIYCFKNWFNGEIVEGPIVRRHWLSFSLLYPRNRMPDPRASLRMLKHGIKVEFSKVKQNNKDFRPMSDDKMPQLDNKKETPEQIDNETFWMVKITFPRRLMDQMEADLDFYEDEVDIDDVESAKDSGIDDESAYNTDEQAPDQPQGDPFASPEGDEQNA
jgi:hypothetical protein